MNEMRALIKDLEFNNNHLHSKIKNMSETENFKYSTIMAQYSEMNQKYQMLDMKYNDLKCRLNEDHQRVNLDFTSTIAKRKHDSIETEIVRIFTILYTISSQKVFYFYLYSV